MEGRRWLKLTCDWWESEWLAELPVIPRLLWPVLLAHVKTHGTKGQMRVPKWERVAAYYDVPADALRELFEAAVQHGAIDVEGETLTVVKWEAYQNSESSERVKRFRSKEPVTVTECNVTETRVTPENENERENENESIGAHSHPDAQPPRGKGEPPKRESGSKPFVPPSYEAAEGYALDIGLPTAEARKFVDYWESIGWKRGRTPMKDWRASLRTWAANYRERQPTGAAAAKPPNRVTDIETLRRATR